MSQELEAVLGYMEAHPGADRAQVMRELGISARLVAKAEDHLFHERQARSRRRRKLGLASTVLLLALGGGYLGWGALRERERAAKAEVQQTERARAERDLYQALDQRDPARVELARGHLASEDEAVRLASLRYLLGVGASDPSLLALLEDPAERVRRAAIQLLAASPAGPGLPGLEERLLGIALAPERAQAERLLALDGILERQPGRGLAEALLPLVSDPEPALRTRGEEALCRLLGRPALAPGGTPRERRERWRELLVGS